MPVVSRLMRKAAWEKNMTSITAAVASYVSSNASAPAPAPDNSSSVQASAPASDNDNDNDTSDTSSASDAVTAPVTYNDTANASASNIRGASVNVTA